MISVIVSKITGTEKNNISLNYSKTMVSDRFFHILKFLHFENKDNPPKRDDPQYDRLWKIRNIFDTLNNKFYELYNPTEHLTVEVIVLFKGRVIFSTIHS